VKVKFENRELKAGAKGVTDSFRPYERHVYVW
jgi:hypothetical protein